MSEELISKKELLELKNITYGQLYRWKRKNLIPEDWFIRKSTFTGQETFFLKEKILQRIDRIINMKEDLSLTNLADVFSPGMPGISEKKDVLVSRGIVSVQAMEIYSAVSGKGEVLDFNDMLIAYAAEKLLASGDATIDETKLAVETLEANYGKFSGKSCRACGDAQTGRGSMRGN